MPVLRRAASRRIESPLAVVFVSRNLTPVSEELKAFNEIWELERELDGAIVVLACDEMGVVPSHRHRTGPHLEGVPAHFHGVRPWLRQRLCGAYGCVHVQGEPDGDLANLSAQVRLAESALETAAARYEAVESAVRGLPDATERLRPEAERLRDARQDYLRALSRWLDAKVRSRVARRAAQEGEGSEESR